MLTTFAQWPFTIPIWRTTQRNAGINVTATKSSPWWCDNHCRLYYRHFKHNCEEFHRKSPYLPYDTEFTILTDWPFDDIYTMMDVTPKFNGRGSYWEPIVPVFGSFMQNYTTLNRHFCSPGSYLAKYAAPNNCSLSWMTMIINAGERALAIAGIRERLSYKFVLKCYSAVDVCRGISMHDAFVYVNTIG